MKKKRPARKRGPKEERLKLKGDWRTAAQKALQKNRPEQWPEGKAEKK